MYLRRVCASGVGRGRGGAGPPRCGKEMLEGWSRRSCVGCSFGSVGWIVSVAPEMMSYGLPPVETLCSAAARAVGTANGRNPIWFVVPCHRLVGADGSLTGYGGGLEVKQALLELERGVSFVDALQQARAEMT